MARTWNNRAVAAMVIVFAVITGGFVATQSAIAQTPAATGGTVSAAVTGSQFDPGNIISNDRFFDSNAMSQAQIQAFLNQMVPTCRSTNANLPCLKDLVTLTNTRAPDPRGRCAGYNSEGYETGARVIWRVAQACGINPQVILVMLQKEQGLVTSTRPSSWSYQAAMGADCPDTAACDSRYMHFYNQVYRAAWQMKEYTLNPNYWNHRVGWTNVRYSPNSACGSSAVYIQNQATANLYNYTPYQPNASALANMYGVGDGCGAYGNRNFWRDFNNWFGSSTVDGTAAINSLYASMGAEGGALGAPTTGMLYVAEGGGGTARAFVNGSIYWTIRTGAAAVLEPERAVYFQNSGAAGPLGWPISQSLPISGPGGAGRGQAFSKASIYSSPSGSFVVTGAMQQTYFARGGAAGYLGFPISREIPFTGGTAQSFQLGTVYMQSNGWGGAVSAPLIAAYAKSGGPTGTLGWPRSDTSTISANGGGTGQAFERGSLYGSPAGAFIVNGAIRDFYFTKGGSAGSLGWPKAAAVCATAADCRQDFQYGTVYWTQTAGARIGTPAIETYAQANAATLGARVSDAIRSSDNGGGFGQSFANGSVYSSAAGTFRVQGAVRNYYWGLGGSAGALGWPTGEWKPGATGRPGSQSFQKGTIYSDGTTSYLGDPAIEQVWWAAGGPAGALGQKSSGVIQIPQNGGGRGQAFVGGSVYASAAGAFAVSGGVLTTYFSHGGSAGTLGWPVAVGACTNGTCVQKFQSGTITYSPSTGGIVTR
jgi:uncharacterized protein with LGFP repeats